MPLGIPQKHLKNSPMFGKQRDYTIVYLPKYSPELNPTEILWRKMKYEWIRVKDYKDKECLHLRINDILHKFGTEEFKINFKKDFNIDYENIKFCKDIYV